jgi:HEAT repeat protein
VSLSRDPFDPLVQALYRSGGEGRRTAAEALRQRGEPGTQIAAEALIHALQRDTIPLRSAAAYILRRWHEFVPVEPLFLAMQDSEQEVRTAA